MTTVKKESCIYVVMGLSGSGKDTVASNLDVINVKWSAYAKRFLEGCYGLASNSLDDREARLQLVPGESFTYLDVLKRAYEAWDIIDTKLTVRPTKEYIQTYLEDGYNVVLTDTRKYSEVEAIKELSNAGYKVCVIYIYGRLGETRLAPDELLEGLIAELISFSDEYHKVMNNRTEGALFSALRKLGLPVY